MTEEQILSAVGPLVKEKHLACKDALELAARLQVKPSEIGKVCDRHEIRIINCQLGCFGMRGKKR